MYHFKRKQRNKDKPLPLFDNAGIKVKKKPDLKAKLDKEFSLYIRLRDSMPNGYFRCISCGEIKPFEQADCGHYINRQHMNTRYDEMNCNAQCRKAKKNQTRRYSDFEYTELIKYYKSLNAKLRKEKGL